MNDLDKILKEALDGYEAPFNSQMWDKVSSQLSPIEDAFRNSVDSYEAPYNPAAWSAIKNKIGSSNSLWKWITGSAAAIALTTVAVMNIPSSEIADDNKIANENASNTEKTVVTDENLTTQNNTTTIGTDLSNDTQPLTNQNSGSSNNNTSSNSTDNNNGTTTQTTSSNNNNPTNLITPADERTEVGVAQELKFKADFSMSANEICAGDFIHFNPKITKQGLIYSWHFGETTINTVGGTNHTFDSPGDYIVVLKVMDPETNKVLASSSENIRVNEIPMAQFELEKSNDAIPQYEFSPVSNEQLDLIWKINGKPVSDRSEFTYTFREEGAYQVKLSATNEVGCTSESSQIVTIQENFNLFAPTGINLSSNNYASATFMPGALYVLERPFVMTIYDKEGVPVYTTTNTENPWDGRINNAEAPAGSYIWTVELKNANGIVEMYKGQLFLTR
jgi:hypothetical protein